MGGRRDSLLEEARRALTGSGVLLEGPAGIGQTAVWQRLRAEAERSGTLVMSAAPAESERLLPYAALADLLRPLADRIRQLPAPQRVAAEVVLVSADATEAFDERTVGATTRSLLEAALVGAGDRPVLIALDDAQWLDRPSERALRFALRRLSRRPALMIAVRSESAEAVDMPLGLDLFEPPLRRFVLSPLGVGALHHVLRARLDVSLPRPLLSRITRDSGGNPLMAIEIARAVLRLPEMPGPGDDLPVAASMQQLLSDTVDALPAETKSAIRLASLLTSPTLVDLVAAGIDPMALDPAEEAGMIEVGAASVRFSHPLHAAAVRAGIPAGVRRRLQRGLANTVAEPDERARQLARGTVEPDAGIAGELEDAARRQLARGAPDLAAELFERSAGLTPRHGVDDRSRRLLAAIRARYDSGDHTATEAAAAAAAEELVGDAKAEALLLRAVVAFVTIGHPPAVTLGEQALRSASPGSTLAGRIHAHLTIFDDSPHAAIWHGEAALELLAGSPAPVDTELLCSAMLTVFYNEVRAGRNPRLELLDKALKLEGDAPPWLGGSIPALWWSAIDEHERAGLRMREHLRIAQVRGDEPLQLEVLLHLVQSELLNGTWAAAEEHLAQARDLGEQLGTGLDEENYLQALLAINRGELDTVGPIVQEGLRRALELDDSWGRRVYGVLDGQIELSTGRYAKSAAIFGSMAAGMRTQGLVEPLATRWEPDWIEACVGAGDLAAAAEVLDSLAARHTRLSRPWTSLGLARSRVLIAASSGIDTTPALTDLAAARAAVPPNVLPLDRARCLLVAGAAHRRAKRKREARDALTVALAEFTALGATSFAARAEAELTRLGTRPTAPLELTATEQRVAQLAAQGRTNRVIANLLFISPKTVEANLARAYRKLGISTRAELGARLGSATDPQDPRTAGQQLG